MTIPTEALARAVKALQPITATQAALPQLGAVTITPGERMTVSGTNMDIWAERYLDYPLDGPAPFSIRSDKLHAALSKISHPELTIELDGTDCALTAGRSEFHFPVITDPVPFMGEQGWSDPQQVELLPSTFHRLLPFCSSDSTRPQLQGIHLTDGAFEACTGRAYSRITAEVKGEAIIPAQLCKLVSEENDQFVEMRLSPTMVQFTGKDWQVAGKLIAGEYPNTAMFHKQEAWTRITAPRKELIEAAQVAALPLSKAVDAIWVRCTESELHLHTPGYRKEAAKYRGAESASQKVEAAVSNPQDFAVSASGLAVLLRSLGVDEITLTLSAPVPILLMGSHNRTTSGLSLMRLES